MEDTLISIDSKYRDFTKYPNESKFTINFEKIYKNIVAVKLTSLEMTNSINYISSIKGNNYISLHFPNIINDPDGVMIEIDNTQLQNINTIISEFNSLLNFNLLDKSSERYFYIFYLNNNSQIIFDFNSNTSPPILKTPLVITKGWYSMYGLNNLIQNYVELNYNARKTFLKSNPNSSSIPLDNGNFTIYSFSLNIFDRRFNNNIRNDIISQSEYNSTNISINLVNLKNYLYSFYVNDIINYIPNINGTGILDILYKNYFSIYYQNNLNQVPELNNVLYHIIMSYSSDKLKVSYTNDFTSYYYTTNNWNTITKFTNSNILSEDIPQFQIDFSNDSRVSSFNNNIINISNLKYPSIGYYLGYRLLNNSFVLSPIKNGLKLDLTAIKNYNLLGEDYIFLRINDWGNFDFFNQILFSKIFLRSDLTATNKTNNYINKEYVFKQLTNINRLDIELVDYLGNNVDLNGIDFSFTLSLRTQVNIGHKQLFELQNYGYN
jgi:hypothetical protein